MHGVATPKRVLIILTAIRPSELTRDILTMASAAVIRIIFQRIRELWSR
jgi:hypothetical protein